MRPHDLPSLRELAKKNRHGTLVKYFDGCRCRVCVRKYRAYVRQLEINQARGQRNNFVPAAGVREFLLDMQKLGIGYMTIARVVGVGKTKLGELLWPPKDGAPKWIRAQKERKVLSYVPTLDTMPGILKIPAGETVRMLRQMIAWGYPQRLIGREAFGVKWTLQVHALQGRCQTVKVSTALRVRAFFQNIEALRAVWRHRHGPIPRDRYVYWKEGSTGCTIQQMELREFIRGFDFHYRYPRELREAIRLTNLLEKKTREAKRAKEYAGGFTQSPVRHAGKSYRGESSQGSGSPKAPNATRQGRGRRESDDHRSGQDRERLYAHYGRGAGHGLLRQAVA